MSSETRRPLAQAQADAAAFCAMFLSDSWLEWHIAGSVRRRRPDVGDVEHVIVPRIDVVEGCASLFPEPTSLLWLELEELVSQGKCSRAVYSDGRGRWGDRYRGVEFRGFKHELFTASMATRGLILAIRTGPADFSRELVTRLKRRGLQAEGGRVIYTRGKAAGETIDTRAEATVFELAGLPWIPPEQRDGTDIRE